MSKQGRRMFPIGTIYCDKGKSIFPKSISLHGEINGFFSSCNLRQVFRNDSGAPVKVGYMFTLPWNTELLGMNIYAFRMPDVICGKLVLSLVSDEENGYGRGIGYMFRK